MNRTTLFAGLVLLSLLVTACGVRDPDPDGVAGGSGAGGSTDGSGVVVDNTTNGSDNSAGSIDSDTGSLVTTLDPIRPGLQLGSTAPSYRESNFEFTAPPLPQQPPEGITGWYDMTPESGRAQIYAEVTDGQIIRYEDQNSQGAFSQNCFDRLSPNIRLDDRTEPHTYRFGSTTSLMFITTDDRLYRSWSQLDPNSSIATGESRDYFEVVYQRLYNIQSVADIERCG